MRAETLILRISLCAAGLLLLGLLVHVATQVMPQRTQTLLGQAADQERSSAARPLVLAEILKALTNARLIYLDREKMMIVTPPEDLLLRLEAWRGRARTAFSTSSTTALSYWEGVVAGEVPPSFSSALTALHGGSPTDVGAEIRSGVDNWNALHSVAAIRDSAIAAPGIDRGWSAFSVFPGSPNLERALPVGAALSYEDYGYFALGDAPQAPAGHWRTARGGRTDGKGDPALIRFRRVAPSGAPLTIDVLGFGAGGRLSVRDGSGAPIGAVRPICDQVDKYDPVTGSPAPECAREDGYSHRVLLPPAFAEREIVVDVAPAPQRPAKLAPILYAEDATKGPLPLSWSSCGRDAVEWDHYVASCQDAEWTVYGDGRPIVLLCRRSAIGEPECALDWFELPPQPEDDPPLSISIGASGGVELVSLGPETPSLTEPSAEAVAQVDQIEDLGLQVLLGAGPEDPQGLAGAYWRKKRRDSRLKGSTEPHHNSLTLSLDTDMQRAVADVVENWSGFPDGRAVAIAILDASGRCWDGCAGPSDRGAIRAAYAGRIRRNEAGSFRAGVGVDFSRGVWNYLGASAWLRRVGSSAGDLASFAWFSDGSHFAPGSSFKSVTALAAIKEAASSRARELETTLRGRDDAAAALNASPLPDGVTAHLRYIELPYETLNVPKADCGPAPEALQRSKRTRICNFGRPARVYPPKQTGCRTGTRSMLGLCEAVRSSVNNYFVALGLALEKHAPSHLSGRAGETPVVEMAKRLVPEFYPLIRSEALGNKWSRFSANGFSAVESAEGFSQPVSKLFALGQNSFGHHMQTNTAAMAAVYAAIATGCRVTPWLEGGAERCRPLFSDDPRRNARALALMRETLVPGLWAVVNRGGTASSAFGGAPWRRRVHAKTGTAEFGKHSNTAWLTGWIEPDKAGDETGRYAFACMVTETSRTGGKACGPLMRAILQKLEERKS